MIREGAQRRCAEGGFLTLKRLLDALWCNDCELIAVMVSL